MTRYSHAVLGHIGPVLAASIYRWMALYTYFKLERIAVLGAGYAQCMTGLVERRKRTDGLHPNYGCRVAAATTADVSPSDGERGENLLRATLILTKAISERCHALLGFT